MSYHVLSCYLQVAWEQHGRKTDNPVEKDSRLKTYHQDEEMVALLRPPDNFRRLSVIPGHNDLCSGVEPFLRPNLVAGRYPDVETYLDVQFRLLREDFFRPLREGLQEYKTIVEGKAPWKNRRIRVDNLRLYQDVRVIKSEKERDEQTYYVLQFAGMKGIRWENSKRLIFGSLLLLSVDNFQSFLLFTVSNRDLELLSNNSIKVRFCATFLK